MVHFPDIVPYIKEQRIVLLYCVGNNFVYKGVSVYVDVNMHVKRADLH